MISVLELLIVSFATFRVARMVAKELGPFEVFKRFRDWLPKKFPPQQQYGVFRPHWVDAGFNCPLCVGFWTSGILYLMWCWNVSQVFVIMLAIAGLQVFIQIWSDHLESDKK